MSRSFTIRKGETLEDLRDRCKNLTRFPKVLLDRQIAPIEDGVFKFCLHECPKGFKAAQTEHVLGLLAEYPQVLWQDVSHCQRLIHGHGITLHVSIYSEHINYSQCKDDNASDDGKAYVSPVLLGGGNKLFVKKIIQAPQPRLTNGTQAAIAIPSFAGSLAHYAHQLGFSQPLLPLGAVTRLLQQEVTVEAVSATVGLLPLDDVYAELVTVGETEVLEQMKVNRQKPGTLPQLIAYLNDNSAALTFEPIVTLADGFQCRRWRLNEHGPDTVVIEKYQTWHLGDYYKNRYFYLEAA